MWVSEKVLAWNRTAYTEDFSSVWSVVHLFLLPRLLSPPPWFCAMSSKNDRGRPLPPSLPPFLPSVWPRVSLSVRQCSSWSFPPLAPSSSSLNQTLVCRWRNCLPAAHHFPGCAPLNISTRHHIQMPSVWVYCGLAASGIRAKPREASEATLIALCVLFTLKMFWLLCFAVV